MSDQPGVGDTQNSSGGSASTGDGSANANGKDDSTSGDKSEKYVPLADHKKYLDKFYATRDERDTLKSQLEEERAKRAALEEQRLRETNDYKSLFEKELERAKSLEDSNKKLKSSLVHNERYRSVMPILRKEGLLAEAEDLVDQFDLSEIEVEATSSGRLMCSGHEDVAARFKQKYPFAFKKKTLDGVNGGGGSGLPTSSEKVDAHAVINAENQYRAGKISKDDYLKVYKRYKESQA